MRSAIIHNLSNEEYHHGDVWREYLSSTQLKNYSVSPKYAKYRLDNPQEQTDAMRLGSVFHGLMSRIAEHKGDYTLGHDKWVHDVAVFRAPINEKTGCPYGSATKAYKDSYQSFLESNNDKTIATSNEMIEVMQMVQSLLNDCGSTSEQVCKLLKWSRAFEVSYFYETEDGIKLKIRPDLLTSNKLIDWKTCNLESLDEESIAKHIIKYAYHVSLSMYQWVLHEITGKWYTPYLVFVSKVSPFDCVICNLSDWCYFFEEEDLDNPIVGAGVGAMEFQRLLKLHRDCISNGEWPGVEESITSNDHVMRPIVPYWLEKKYFEE